MLKSKKDTAKILVLLFAPIGRDAEAVIPLCWGLEKMYGYQIIFGSMFDSVYLIDKLRPQVVLLCNIAGASFNVEAADYAYDKGIIVITLTSEGLFRKPAMESFIWDNYKKKEINWHKMFVWSETFLKMAKEFLPLYKNTLDVSGSTGIDRYKIYKPVSRIKFLKKYKKEKFKKVVLYAGFTFAQAIKIGEDPKMYKYDFVKVKSILKSLVVKNTDILFIFKKHPGEDSNSMDVDSGWKHENLLLLSDEETLVDLISVSDILFVYKSTVSFEAYTLGKIVVNIFPSPLNKHYQLTDQRGNCFIKNFSEAQKIIDEYYLNGQVKCFEKKSGVREELIKEKIYSNDGYNSLRTAKKIDSFLVKLLSKYRAVFYGGFNIKGLLLHVFLKHNKIFHLIPRFRHSFILYNYNTFSKIYELRDKYYPQIKRYYERSAIVVKRTKKGY